MEFYCCNCEDWGRQLPVPSLAIFLNRRKKWGEVLKEREMLGDKLISQILT